VAALALGAGLLVLFAVDPAESRLYPPCLLHWATGLHCPTCGVLRATHSLLHGHVADAFRLNPLLVLGLPVLGLAAWRRAWLARPWVPWAALAALVLFGIARNLPLAPFAALAPH
jgi:hypothetical protein